LRKSDFTNTVTAAKAPTLQRNRILLNLQTTPVWKRLVAG